VITLAPRARADAPVGIHRQSGSRGPRLRDIEVAWSELTRAPGSSYAVSYDPEHDVADEPGHLMTEHQQLYPG